MGVVASLAITPILIEVARDEELREIERKRLERLKALPGKGFVLGDIDLDYVKKIKTSSPTHKHDGSCTCGCPKGDCKMKDFHENVEKIYLTGDLKPKYEALFKQKTPRTTLENNFFILGHKGRPGE
ncbi:unnamed protein product [Lepeophtheirus salmonis]|uniref:(salmon louse) hypothetical protein n=1 Tax=Lepeophtheirus salmonis TaxID=72036 RepID=A0A7R8GZH6_LEPSM|nr:unnamed protein product [Lepeophtheirus salmonis]CAF2753548.1 unnamed protein product [Lepeophtheirus salmonis]